MKRSEILQRAADFGIEVREAAMPSDMHCVGIHLLNPTDSELDDAVDRAEQQGFRKVIIHTIFEGGGK